MQLMKQNLMRKVIYALIPLSLSAVFFYGWRILILIGLNTAFAIFVEWLFIRKTTKKVTEAVIVTAVLYSLTLPPTLPFWISILGIGFGVLFGKMVFGGFGKNPFNPALVGRAFIYINFPTAMTTKWLSPDVFSDGITSYSIDTVSSATPMMTFKAMQLIPDIKMLLIGNIAGSSGETSAVLIIIIAAVLLWQKIISKDTFFSVLISFVVFSGLFYLWMPARVLPPQIGLFSGGLLFGTTFMATDPISSPKTTGGKRLYGALIGLVTVIIRSFSLFSGGMMFAILMGNTFAPIIDEMFEALKQSKKRKSETQLENGGENA